MKQPITAREKVLAIAELNKMDGAYPQGEKDNQEGIARFFEFFATLRGYNPQQLPEAKETEKIEGDEQ